jgi:hypothetical protein
VNARAFNLALKLRGYLVSLPGADSISLHAQEGWALFLIMASSDEAVISLGEELGLTCNIMSEEGRWWHVAKGEREEGALRCEVSGPRHRGQPPSSRAAAARPGQNARAGGTSRSAVRSLVRATLGSRPAVRPRRPARARTRVREQP